MTIDARVPGATKQITGTILQNKGSFLIQISVGSKDRRAFACGTLDREEAERRRERVQQICTVLRQAGMSADFVASMCREAAQGDATRAEIAMVAANAVASSPARVEFVRAQGDVMYWGDFADLWTSGKLAKDYPDHIKEKSSASDDACRAGRLKRSIGNVRLDAFTLDDAERAMRELPESLTAATRRQYAQIIARTLSLAVYPCRLIERSPLPVGWLPKNQTQKAMNYLFPDEDAKLLACRDVSLLRRMLYGFLAREGLRLGEALALRWTDVDLERGTVRLDENKTEDPRMWALDLGVAEALRRWKRACPPSADDALVFERAEAELDGTHAAGTFRHDLRVAGVKRKELFEKKATRQPIRVHDLRATFVTLALAAGKTERWVTDRTGHRSSQMLSRYARSARTWEELGFVAMLPLADAIPDLTDF
jgi:integrase